MKPIRIATRKSELALWQARWVQHELETAGHASELVLIETQGDKDYRPFELMQGQGFFTKAVQDAVLENRADVAVHSHKDLPSLRHEELELAAVTERADPRELLLLRPEAYDEAAAALPLRPGVRVGTSAARRRAQLAHLRPDLELAGLRGNVPTRVEALRAGHYEGILLAAAGLDRLDLNLDELQAVRLEPEQFVPAPAQGALALECRRRDYDLAALLTDLHAPHSYRAVAAERGLMAMLQGGCQLALGAYARNIDKDIELIAWYEGKQVRVRHPSSEGVAILAYEALGRPAPVGVS